MLVSLHMEFLHRFRRWKLRWVAMAGMMAWAFFLLTLSVVVFWACEASRKHSSGRCKKVRKVFSIVLGALGLFTGPTHRCPIPLIESPYMVKIPELRKIAASASLLNLTYIEAENASSKNLNKLFGGHQTWQQRDDSFSMQSRKKIHCGFVHTAGPIITPKDSKYLNRCRFLVLSAIFDSYDDPHQPSSISLLSQEIFCFIMVVDPKSLKLFEDGGLLSQDEMGRKWVGIWQIIELKNLPFDEPRRNGKLPKLLLHRLFPETQYSIWIDGKLELVVDPLLILERYLWRDHNSFAIAQHKHHRSVYQEAEAVKRRKRYARPLVDKHMDVYRKEGLKPWSAENLPLPSDVPEGALIVREHTPAANLFSCLWFNEVNRFTPRDQISFGYVLHRLKSQVSVFMFPNCEYNTLVTLHKHVREHSSELELVKHIDEIEFNQSAWK